MFAGRVVAGSLRISCLRGNRCDALQGLSLPPEVGLGGRAMTLGRPVSVRDYSTASGITHEHDIAVGWEGLRALVAIPVAVRGEVAAVLYGGVRAVVQFGDQVVAQLVSAGYGLARELESSSERQRRIAQLRAAAAAPAPGLRCADLREVAEQLMAGMANTSDGALRDEVRHTCQRLLAALGGQSDAFPPPVVSARELDVLNLAAAGCSDAEIAEQLDVTVGAVQGAVRNLRRAFGVRSRYAAVAAARRAGVLS
ncbi:LuxR family transcriptional regulator [Mycobacterium lentiflavum]|uniref:LuxR family transcriptional regulator n=1 Tax=Mycobacterium lentiflavum TaxID=141349 RepID=A0A0E4H2I0_MYCLN|nr:LuxR C-terminal-related transcriptional regulator [Mycobacterium lentiflavum]CQD24330.1 LuxR family transcriptional regulator [Mycobacterium lentiflavum]